MMFGAASLLGTDPLLQQVSDQPSVFDQAVSQYPILSRSGLAYTKSPGGNGNLLEFWPPNEQGSPSYQRPAELPIDKPGVQVFSDQVRPIDILGDAVSHHLVNTDPTLKKVYSAFENSITPDQEKILQQQYQYAQQNEGETRDFSTWKDMTGLPAMFRGYPFQQWPQEFNQKVYTPKQMQLLDKMMEYLQQ